MAMTANRALNSIRQLTLGCALWYPVQRIVERNFI